MALHRFDFSKGAGYFGGLNGYSRLPCDPGNGKSVAPSWDLIRGSLGDFHFWGARIVMATQKPRQFIECLLVNFALEFNHKLQRHPIILPAPGIKLGMGTRAKLDIAIPPDEPQQIPDLLLAFVGSAPLP